MTEIAVEGGFVRLDAVNADDLSVVNAARVSFGRYRSEMDSADEGLIRFLMREHHGTPFEHNFFRFHVRAPIFVVREWFRHRIGWSYNEFSARYAEMPEGAWTPTDEAVRTQVGKPGAYRFEALEPVKTSTIAGVIDECNDRAWRTYQYLLKQGLAKEVARVVLPVATYSEFYASTNARALLNFCALRSAETAQREIRLYSQALEALLAEAMPVTYAAWVEAGRVAP